MREPAQGQAGAVDGGLADDALQTAFADQEPHLQLGGMFPVELIHGDDLALQVHRLNSGPR
jgi:hypothetical protein